MNRKIELPQWLGRPILDPEDAQHLERDAALNEFGKGMDRSSAEGKAHEDYVKRKHEEAAAHHLAGLKHAEASKDEEAAQKHSMMYELHCKKLGHESVGTPDPNVQAIADKGQKVKFKPNKADALVLEKA